MRPSAAQPRRLPRDRQRPRVEHKNPFGDNNARAVAFDLAEKAYNMTVPFDQIWDSHPGLVALPKRERALAIHLSAGVLRFKRRLDRIGMQLTDGKFDGLHERVRWVLRLGLFQVIDCDRIPPHAAVSTAVDAARIASHTGIAGMVNAVLRRAARERDALKATVADPTLSVGERLSLPDWIADIMVRRYPEARVEQIDRWINSPPNYYFRVAASRADQGLAQLMDLIERDDLGVARQHPDFPAYVSVSTAALVSDSPLFAEPLGWVQNPAAELVIRLLDPQPGETVIDLFAAPGGKSMLIAEQVGPDGQVFAVDKSELRLQRLVENKVRLGFENILPIVGDASALGDRAAPRVLADVPCSAFGTLAKNPEVRWTKSADDITRLARSQRLWLIAASRHVAHGGVLVYATCTLPRQENEDVVNAFLIDHSDFVRDDIPDSIPRKYVSGDGIVMTTPPVDGLDGVFAARLRRKE
ncbi:MAG TPA: 16S rRNA (cytosine(967)-C(5))-methyltransferase RsmB [candidate division Zixibacteria bacterium]|jgi:16S rRNA (cytosine967-C5)-methyltransferase